MNVAITDGNSGTKATVEKGERKVFNARNVPESSILSRKNHRNRVVSDEERSRMNESPKIRLHKMPQKGP